MSANVGEPESRAPDRPAIVVPRSSWLLPYLVVGLGYIIAGGLLAAATAYVTTQKTAWATAYIVLVGGVVQIGLGAAVTWLTPRAPSRSAWEVLVFWNLGNAGVLAGQLAGLVVLTDIGTVSLVVALVLLLIAVRVGRQRDPGRAEHPVALWLLRGLVVLLAITMPIGVLLAHLGS